MWLWNLCEGSLKALVYRGAWHTVPTSATRHFNNTPHLRGRLGGGLCFLSLKRIWVVLLAFNSKISSIVKLLTDRYTAALWMIVGWLLWKSRLQPNMKQGETSWKTQKIIIFLIKSKLNRSYIFPTTNPPQSKACASPGCKMTRSRYLVSIISQLWPFHDIRVEYKDCQSFRSCP